MISGNHDSDDRLNFGKTPFANNNVYIAAVFNGQLEKVVVEEDTKLNIFMLPFVKASQVRHYYPKAEINNYEDAVKTIIANTEIDKTECNILVAHQFVAGNNDPELGGSEGAGTQMVGLVEKIGYGCFDDFDYVALGHIHSPQKIGREEVRYSGSPLKYSLSEVNNNKSVPIITVSADKSINIDLIPLKPMRDMRHIKGKMKDLLSKENLVDTNDFIYATLTDEDYVNDVMGIFQQHYPNTVKIDYDNSHTNEVEQIDISRIAENRSFSELIGDFYKQVYGCDISDEEMDIMKSVAREAGVINEAD